MTVYEASALVVGFPNLASRSRSSSTSGFIVVVVSGKPAVVDLNIVSNTSCGIEKPKVDDEIGAAVVVDNVVVIGVVLVVVDRAVVVGEVCSEVLFAVVVRTSLFPLISGVVCDETVVVPSRSNSSIHLVLYFNSTSVIDTISV